jgi:hypothetical protein
VKAPRIYTFLCLGIMIWTQGVSASQKTVRWVQVKVPKAENYSDDVSANSSHFKNTPLTLGASLSNWKPTEIDLPSRFKDTSEFSSSVPRFSVDLHKIIFVSGWLGKMDFGIQGGVAFQPLRRNIRTNIAGSSFEGHQKLDLIAVPVGTRLSPRALTWGRLESGLSLSAIPTLGLLSDSLASEGEAFTGVYYQTAFDFTLGFGWMENLVGFGSDKQKLQLGVSRSFGDVRISGEDRDFSATGFRVGLQFVM